MERRDVDLVSLHICIIGIFQMMEHKKPNGQSNEGNDSTSAPKRDDPCSPTHGDILHRVRGSKRHSRGIADREEPHFPTLFAKALQGPYKSSTHYPTPYFLEVRKARSVLWPPLRFASALVFPHTHSLRSQASRQLVESFLKSDRCINKRLHKTLPFSHRHLPRSLLLYKQGEKT